jgi:hypothetical protein
MDNNPSQYYHKQTNAAAAAAAATKGRKLKSTAMVGGDARKVGVLARLNVGREASKPEPRLHRLLAHASVYDTVAAFIMDQVRNEYGYGYDYEHEHRLVVEPTTQVVVFEQQIDEDEDEDEDEDDEDDNDDAHSHYSRRGSVEICCCCCSTRKTGHCAESGSSSPCLTPNNKIWVTTTQLEQHDDGPFADYSQNDPSSTETESGDDDDDDDDDSWDEDEDEDEDEDYESDPSSMDELDDDEILDWKMDDLLCSTAADDDCQGTITKPKVPVPVPVPVPISCGVEDARRRWSRQSQMLCQRGDGVLCTGVVC